MSPARTAAAHAEVGHVPAVVRRDAGPAPGALPVGSPGKVGVLELGFGLEAGGARTVLVSRFQKSPLQVMRPLYCDPGLPDAPVAYVMSTGGGIVDGDRLRVDVAVAEGAHAVVTTQAATKAHRCERGYATQSVELDVGPGGVCEWVPDPLVPFAGSRLHQRIRARVAEDAVLLVAEVAAAGRLGRGEEWGLDAYTSTVELSRPGEADPFAVDTTRLVGAERGGGPAVMAGHRAVGTLLVVAPRERAGPARELADVLHDSASGGESRGVRAGAGTLPGDSGAWLRVLGSDTDAVVRVVTAAWSAARRRYAGAPAPDLRKG